MSTTTTTFTPSPFVLPLRFAQQGIRTGPAGAGESANLSTLALYLISHYDTDQKLVSTVHHLFGHPAENTEHSKELRGFWYSMLYESREQRRGPTFADLHEQACTLAFDECSLPSRDKLSRGESDSAVAAELMMAMRPILLSLITVEYSWKYGGGSNGLVPGLQVLGYDSTTHKRIWDTAVTDALDYTQQFPIRPDVRQIGEYRSTISQTMRELWRPGPVPREIAHYVEGLPNNTPPRPVSQGGSRQSAATHALFGRPRRRSTSSGTGVRAIALHRPRRSQTGGNIGRAFAQDATGSRTMAGAVSRLPTMPYSKSRQTIPASHEGVSSVANTRTVAAAAEMLFAHLARTDADIANLPDIRAIRESYQRIVEDEALRLPPTPTSGVGVPDYRGSQAQTFQSEDRMSTDTGTSDNANESFAALLPQLPQPEYSREPAAHSGAHGQYDNLATDTPQLAGAASQYNLFPSQLGYTQTYNNLEPSSSLGSTDDNHLSGGSEPH